jgi:hypothetical protein
MNLKKEFSSPEEHGLTATDEYSGLKCVACAQISSWRLTGIFVRFLIFKFFAERSLEP